MFISSTLASGEVRRLTTQNRFISGVDWSPDGQSLVLLRPGRTEIPAVARFAKRGNERTVNRSPRSVRTSVILPSPPVRPEARFRVAYQTMIHDVSLRLVELNPTGPSDPVGTAAPFADATEGRDCGARFSPDASQIAFFSWPVRRESPLVGSPRWLRPASPHVHSRQEIRPGGWSPDGRQIVFDADPDGNSDIYITDDGRRKTDPPHFGTVRAMCFRPGRPTAAGSTSLLTGPGPLRSGKCRQRGQSLLSRLLSRVASNPNPRSTAYTFTMWQACLSEHASQPY